MLLFPYTLIISTQIFKISTFFYQVIILLSSRKTEFWWILSSLKTLCVFQNRFEISASYYALSIRIKNYRLTTYYVCNKNTTKKSNDLHVFVVCLKLNLLKSSFFYCIDKDKREAKKSLIKKDENLMIL